jgi:effector-binding domain-containing protein
MTSPLRLHERKGHQMFDVTIRTEPARRIAAVAHQGPYLQVGQSFDKLARSAAGGGFGARSAR